MKLSTKSTYGLRAMLNIAIGNGAVSISGIAKNEGISVAYLEQLLNKLRRRGLVGSIRGPYGGYILGKKGLRISVADIVRALEGDIAPVDCIIPRSGSLSSCAKGRSCVSKIVWHKLAKAISDCLESVTLKDLRDEAYKIKRGG